MTHTVEETVKHGAHALGVHLNAQQYEQLFSYISALVKWNHVYNLSALHDADEIAVKHILDSLAVVPSLRAYTKNKPQKLLDVGSGAGLPGAVIAITCSEIDVSCVDASAKKAAFVQQIAGSLALENLHSRHGRVQELRGSFDVVTSRAFSSLADFCASSQHVLAPRGAWLAMKGKRPDGEIAALPSCVEVFHVEQLKVPGLDAERCLVWLRRADGQEC